MSDRKEHETVETAFEDWQGFDPAEPEKNLLKAIVLTALNDLKKEGEPSSLATEYLLDADESYIFSFRSICNFLNVDPYRILSVVGLRDRVGDAPTSGETQIWIAGESDNE